MINLLAMKNLYFPLILFVLLNCGSNDSSEAVQESQQKQIESAVINRFHAMIKYAEAGELENVLKYFEPSGPGSYIDRGTRHTSLQDMIDNLRATWRIRQQDYGVPVTKLYVLSPAYVLLTSSSTLNTTTRDGVVFQPRPWSVSILWMPKDGEWMIHSFHQFEGDMKPVEESQPAKK
jgi:hypothetical protein